MILKLCVRKDHPDSCVAYQPECPHACKDLMTPVHTWPLERCGDPEFAAWQQARCTEQTHEASTHDRVRIARQMPYETEAGI